MALNCKTPPWQERQSRALQFEHSAVRIFISFNVRFITPHRAGSVRAASERWGRILLAVFWSQLLLTASTIIQCQSMVPHFHIPISFVSRGQNGTGALLCEILEGGHRCILLTTAITANGKPAVTTERQCEALQHTFQWRGHWGLRENQVWVTL